jgi:PAS domain S-box-containing protein
MNQPQDRTGAVLTALPSEPGKRSLPGSFRGILSLYVISFLFLTALVVGFVWHDLRAEYRETLDYWNVQLSGSADDRIRISALWLNERRTDTLAIAESGETLRLLTALENKSGNLAQIQEELEQRIAHMAAVNGFLGGAVGTGDCHIGAQAGLRPEMAQGIQEACKEVQRTGEYRVDTFGMEQGHVWLSLSAPVMVESRASPEAPASRRLAGSAIMVAENWQDIVPTFASVSIPKRASETFVVWKKANEAFIFSPRHHARGVPSFFRRPLDGGSFESQVALDGNVAFGEFTNYRGIPIFGVARKIGAPGYSLAREVNRDEALSEYYRHRVMDGLVGALSLLFFGSLLVTQHRHAAARDSEERARQEEALRERERRYKVLFESAADGIVLMRDEQIVDCNQKALELFGCRREELIGNAPSAFSPPQQPNGANSREDGLVKGKLALEGQTLHFAWRHLRGDGTPFEAEVTLSRLEIAGEAHLLALIRDVTEQRRAQEERKRSEGELKSVLASVSDYLWSADIDTQGHMIYRYYSPVVEKITGRPPEFYMPGPERWLSTIHPDDRGRLAAAVGTLITGQLPVLTEEYRIIRPDGAVRWVHDSVQMRRQDGSTRVDGVVSDITERKRAEEELRLTHFSVDHASESILWVDPQSRILYANEAACRSMGRSREELLSLTIPDIDRGFTKDIWDAYWQKLKAQGSLTFETQSETKEGKVFSVEVSANYLEFDGKEFSFSFAHDITERKRAEEALRDREERFRAVFEEGPLGMSIIGMDGRLLRANQTLCTMYGYTEEELCRLKVSDVTPPEDMARHAELTGQVLRGEIPSFRLDKRVIRKDGKLIWTNLAGSVVRAVDGTPLYGLGMIQDITERKRIEEALSQSDRRYKDFISHSREGVWRLELEQPFPIDLPEEEILEKCLLSGYMAECNLSLARSMGFSTVEEVVGKRLRDLVSPSDEERLESFRASIRGGFRGRTGEFRARDNSGALRHLLRTEIPIVQNGMLVRVWGITRDITELRQAEAALRESEARLRLVVSQLPAIVWSTDKDLRYTSHLGAGLRALGVESNQMVGKSVEEFVLSFEPRPGRPDNRPALAGESLSYEIAIKGHDYDVHVEPFRNAAGEITGTLGIALDVSARRQAETALRESEERFRTTFENAGIGMALVDMQGHPIKSNPALREMLGYSEEELCRMAFTEFTHPDDRSLDWALYSELVAGKRERYEIEKRYLKKGGGVVWGQLIVSLVKDRNGSPMYAVGMVQDITERKQAEQALQSSETRFRTLMEKAPVAISISRVGRTLYANQRYLEMYGFQKIDEVVGHSVGEQWAPECRPMVEERARQRARGLPVPSQYEALGQRRDGSEFPVEIVVAPVVLPDGGASIGFLMDITERKRTQEERQRSLEQLRALTARLQSIREEERKRLAREIHDQLGQALTAIKLDLSSLVSELPAAAPPPSKRASSIIKLVDETIQSVRRISTELRPGMLDDLGLVATVEWAGEDFEARTGTKCRLNLPSEDLDVDPEHATAVFRILQETLTNVARHARASEVDVRLARENGVLTLEVHDNGQGIPDDKLSSGKSLGILGMRERALLLGGETTICGSSGKGTTVRVQIPEAVTRKGARS